ncbi:MAG: helix-turn-helix domain-containing protein [Pseudomonadota bacterium]|nr:helix-turn-helix domain-containing protein [Pseudomonadota bacterium]
MITLIYGNDVAVGAKAIDVHVHNIRAKLGDEIGEMIETVRGFGYRFTPASDAGRRAS